jgi:hypothetical protein
MSDILSRIYIVLNIKYLLNWSNFNNCLIFSTDLPQTSFIKAHPVAEELFHADTETDGRTDSITMLIIHFLKPLLDVNDT